MAEIKVLSKADQRFGVAKPNDIGHDLFVQIDREDQTWLDRLWSWVIQSPCIIIWPVVGMRTVRSGVQIQMPDEVWAEIRARSSTSKRKLQILGGTIDSGYRGEYYSVIHNFGLLPKVIAHRDRVAQVVFYYAIRPRVDYIGENYFARIVAKEVEDGGRGTTGFGSTGR